MAEKAASELCLQVPGDGETPCSCDLIALSRRFTTLLPTTGLHKSILKETHILSTVKASLKKITSIKPASVITKTSTAGAVVKSLTKKLGHEQASSSSSGHTVTHKVSTLKKDSPATSAAVASDGLVEATDDPALAPAPEQNAGPAATATDAAGYMATNAAPPIETTFITQDPTATAPADAPTEPTDEAQPSAGLPGNATEPTTTTVTFDGSARKNFGGQGVGVLGGLLGLGLWLV